MAVTQNTSINLVVDQGADFSKNLTVTTDGSTAYDISTIATSAEKTSKVFGDQDGNQETDPRGISFNNDAIFVLILTAIVVLFFSCYIGV